MTKPGQEPVHSVAARTSLVAEAKLGAVRAELVGELSEGGGRVLDPADVARFAPLALVCHRNGDALLVNVEPDVLRSSGHDPFASHAHASQVDAGG
jgi:hypothetical protein